MNREKTEVRKKNHDTRFGTICQIKIAKAFQKRNLK